MKPQKRQKVTLDKERGRLDSHIDFATAGQMSAYKELDLSKPLQQTSRNWRTKMGGD
jgi:hypothetical protein